MGNLSNHAKCLSVWTLQILQCLWITLLYVWHTLIMYSTFYGTIAERAYLHVYKIREDGSASCRKINPKWWFSFKRFMHKVIEIVTHIDKHFISSNNGSANQWIIILIIFSEHWSQVLRMQCDIFHKTLQMWFYVCNSWSIKNDQ